MHVHQQSASVGIRQRVSVLLLVQALKQASVYPQAEDTNGTTAPVAAPAAIEPPRRAMTKGRAGGVYVPPWKQAQLAAMLPPDEEVKERQTWDALRKSLNGHVNKITAQNIRAVVRELVVEVSGQRL